MIKEWEGEELRDDVILNIVGVPIRTYFKKSDDKGLRGKCFNCFGSHSAHKCTFPTCKFCKGVCKVVKHYSLICPKAPPEFGSFMEARNRAKQVRGSGIRFTSAYLDYDFSDTELSDEE